MSLQFVITNIKAIQSLPLRSDGWGGIGKESSTNKSRNVTESLSVCVWRVPPQPSAKGGTLVLIIQNGPELNYIHGNPWQCFIKPLE